MVRRRRRGASEPMPAQPGPVAVDLRNACKSGMPYEIRQVA